ncbi:MFS general substrate transporter [Lindgomyces ingoldianus]|uniref:MFS general substrate transporter n=1 Tax=Lindgomyces ingoldianus TaxID=673940 RepID=A0ACB6QRM8_9PLEO|nr:MFS general substrate transporter [Lindgomyces ingoldianus]KAF2469223.1 MFS general substrate transporter [Lindgomyces ingoldianus]
MAQGPVELDNFNARILNDVSVQQNAQNDSFEPQVLRTEFSLPPVDTGKEAWLFLGACWAIEALVYGFGFSFGVFQDFYSNHEPFAGSSHIAVIGTTTMGVLYMGTPFVLALCRLYPRWARWFTFMGLFVASLSMALSSFCDTVPQLIGTQGILFSIGGCFAYCPCVLYIEEWFAKRKGMAYGIMWSAAGFGGVVLPLLLESLLNDLGFQTATRIWAGVLFATSAPLAFFIKPRLPYSSNTRAKPFNLRFVTSKLFALHQVANIIQATGFFLPGIYLPTYARKAYGASTFLSALTVILVNIAATIGLAIMGSLTDKVHVTTCIITSAMGAATSVLLIWGLSASLPVLYVFCIFYGLFAGCWPSIWPGIMKEVAQRGESDGYGYVDPLMVYGHLCIGRGVGNVISGPLSDALIKGMPWQGQAMGGYGSGYGSLIIFSGLTCLLSGMNFLWKCLDLL